jgi:hypothetical protein
MQMDIERPGRGENPIKRADGRSLSDFPDRSKAENKLMAAARCGVVCKFEGEKPEPGTADDKRERTIDAKFARFLALGGDEDAPVHERGIWVQNAIIDGDLDFTGCDEVRPIALENCLIKGRIILRDARTRTINLDFSHVCGSQVSGNEYNKNHMAIEAKRAKIDGSMYCRRGFRADGEVNFIEAEITGSLECHGGCFRNPEGIAIACSRMKIGGSVFFTSESDHKFTAKGQVRFQRAEIGGDLRCDGGEFIYPERDALFFSRAKITGSAFLGKDINVEGITNFIDAEIGNSLECQGGHFNNPNGIAIYCSRVKVKGSVFFKESFNAKGEVSLRNAHIGGHLVGSTGVFDCSTAEANASEGKLKALSCEGVRIVGTAYFHGVRAEGEINFIDAEIGGSFEWHGSCLSNPRSVALYCSRTNVKGSVFLHQHFKSEGEVSFRSADVGGGFDCSTGTFRNPSGKALSCERARILGKVDLCKSSAYGEVNLIDAEILSSLECKGAHLSNGDGRALYCSRARVTGSVILYDGFRADGEVVFRRAEIGGNLECDTATFSNPEGNALICTRTRIEGNVRMGNGFCARGQVDFSNAEIDGLLGCAGGTFVSKKHAAGANGATGKGDTVICPDALSLRNAVINGTLYLGPANSSPYDKPVTIEGSLDLRDARVAVFVDSRDSWPKEEVCDREGNELRRVIYLDGFNYGRFAGGSPVDVRTREAWLRCQPLDHLKKQFKAQPFEQLIKVYHEMGDAESVRRITILREETRLRRLPTYQDSWGWLRHKATNAWRYFVLENAVGYGHRWYGLVLSVFIIWGVCAAVFSWQGAHFGLSKDFHETIGLEDKAIIEACRTSWNDPKCQFKDKSDYQFNAWKYSAHILLNAPHKISSYVLLPAFNLKAGTIELDQTENWQPANPFVNFLAWFELVFGWAVSVIALMGLTGVIKRA